MPTKKDETLDDRIDRLYAGPAEEFIARRDALVKELKAVKDKDGAATVKALRKPTVAAWAVNQLAHNARRDVAKLLDIGDALREAPEALAAVADPDAGIAVQGGRLTTELAAPSGFGAGLVFATPPAATRTTGSRRDERRAARAARAGRDTRDAAPEPADADADETPTITETDERKAAAERKSRIAAAATECDRRTAEAQQAAREAAKARQEVSRLQDELVTANAKAKAADEKARLTQWAAATAQQALREAQSS